MPLGKQTQGANANNLGRSMENAVEDQLKRAGFVNAQSMKPKFVKGKVTFGDEDLPHPRWYMRNVKKFENIYKVRFFADFVLYDADQYPQGLVIEVKNQEKPGSIDEKYVFTVLSLKELPAKYQNLAAWLVIAGDGMRACAIEWMKSQQVWEKRKKHFRLLTEAQFRRELFAEKEQKPTPAPPTWA